MKSNEWHQLNITTSIYNADLAAIDKIFNSSKTDWLREGFALPLNYYPGNDFAFAVLVQLMHKRPVLVQVMSLTYSYCPGNDINVQF